MVPDILAGSEFLSDGIEACETTAMHAQRR